MRKQAVFMIYFWYHTGSPLRSYFKIYHLVLKTHSHLKNLGLDMMDPRLPGTVKQKTETRSYGSGLMTPR
jgi:hypothetical protein